MVRPWVLSWGAISNMGRIAGHCYHGARHRHSNCAPMVNYMLLNFSLLTLLVCAIVIFLLAIEIGYWLGWKRHHKTDETEKSHSNALQGATLGLLALLLGFTFAMAVSRYDTRRTVIMDQANAIGTAELRSRLLGSPYTEKAAPLFRAYVDAWLELSLIHI